PSHWSSSVRGCSPRQIPPPTRSPNPPSASTFSLAPRPTTNDFFPPLNNFFARLHLGRPPNNAQNIKLHRFCPPWMGENDALDGLWHVPVTQRFASNNPHQAPFWCLCCSPSYPAGHPGQPVLQCPFLLQPRWP